MASASSLAQFNVSEPGEKGLETVEIDPQYSQSLGLAQGDVVSQVSPFLTMRMTRSRSKSA